MSDDLSVKNALSIAEKLTKHYQAFEKLSEVLKRVLDAERDIKDMDKTLERLNQQREAVKAQIENLEGTLAKRKMYFENTIREAQQSHKDRMADMAKERSAALNAIREELDKSRSAANAELEELRKKSQALKNEIGADTKALKGLQSELALLKSRVRDV